MKLTWPSGVTACLGRGEREEQDLRNNRLRPEKFPWKSFRTGVRLPPPPPKKKDTTYVVSFFFGLRPSVIKMLGRNQSALRNSPLRSEFTPHPRRGPKGPYILLDDRHCQGFRPWRKHLHGAKAPPRCAGALGSAVQRQLHLADFHPKRPNVKFRCLKQRAVFPYNRYTWDRR